MYEILFRLTKKLQNNKIKSQCIVVPITTVFWLCICSHRLSEKSYSCLSSGNANQTRSGIRHVVKIAFNLIVCKLCHFTNVVTSVKVNIILGNLIRIDNFWITSFVGLFFGRPWKSIHSQFIRSVVKFVTDISLKCKRLYYSQNTKRWNLSL